MKKNLLRRSALAATAVLCLALSACSSEADYLKMKQDPDLEDAQKYLKREKFDKAKEKLEKALKTEPRNPYARYMLALFNAEQDPAGTAKAVSDAIGDIPSSDSTGLAEAYKALANVYASTSEDWGKAAKAYGKAYDFSKDPEILHEQAFCLTSDGDYKEALKLFETSEGYTPSVARATCKFKMGNIKEAAQEAVDAFDDPAKLDAVLLIYEIAEADAQAVEDALKTAVDKNPGNHWPLVILGDLKKNKNAFEEAIDAYSKALEKEPKSSEIYESIAECHFNLGELGKALDNINKAIDNAKNRDEKKRLKDRRAEMTDKGE